MASGANDPVGEIPPLSDAASKGRGLSAEALSSARDMLSRFEHPARISPVSRTATRTTNPPAFPPFRFDNFIKQSCRAPSLLHKSQAGCHRRGSIYQRFSLTDLAPSVVIAGIIALGSFYRDPIRKPFTDSREFSRITKQSQKQIRVSRW